jgi:hypothetical protein
VPTEEPTEDVTNAEPEDGTTAVTDEFTVTEPAVTEPTVTEPTPDISEQTADPHDTEITPEGEDTDDTPGEEPPAEESPDDSALIE